MSMLTIPEPRGTRCIYDFICSLTKVIVTRLRSGTADTPSGCRFRHSEVEGIHMRICIIKLNGIPSLNV